MNKGKLAFIFICLVASMFLACGFGGEPDDDEDDDDAITISFPLTQGTSWTYQVEETDPDTAYLIEKILDDYRSFECDSVMPEPPDIPWTRQVDAESSFFCNDGDYIWMGEVDSTLDNYGINPFVPFRVVALEYELGDTLITEIHKGSGLLYADITFEAVHKAHEDVTLPDSTVYEDCLKIEASLIVNSALGVDTTLSDIWLKDGIGLIKRFDRPPSGVGKTIREELTDYSIGG